MLSSPSIKIKFPPIRWQENSLWIRKKYKKNSEKSHQLSWTLQTTENNEYSLDSTIIEAKDVTEKRDTLQRTEADALHLCRNHGNRRIG